MISSWSC